MATIPDDGPPPIPGSGRNTSGVDLKAKTGGLETTALEKHSCPACGAQAEWSASKHRLICPYCGTESPYEIDRETGKIQEIDLVTTLREMPEHLRGWKAEKQTVRCRSCKAVSVFDPGRIGQNCEFCGSPELVDYDEIKPPIRPQSVLPFMVDEGKIRDRLRKWFGSKWLAPGKLKKKALVDQVRGIYLPYWTFDAQVSCKWRAQSGTYYTVTETFRDANGRVQTRPVQKVRWRPASGKLDHFFDDDLVPGTQGVPLELLRQVEPFPTAELVPYDTAFLSGYLVEHYRIVLIDAAQASRQQMESQLRRMCGQEVPGDTYRNLEIYPKYSGQTFKHILAPAWHLTYDYHGKSFQVVANGVTGKVAGHYPKSGWKIFFLALMALLVVFLVIYLG